MLHFKNFVEREIRTAEEKQLMEALRKQGYRVTFFVCDDGTTWEDAQLAFDKGTIKVAYNPSNGEVCAYSRNASELMPFGKSILEVPADTKVGPGSAGFRVLDGELVASSFHPSVLAAVRDGEVSNLTAAINLLKAEIEDGVADKSEQEVIRLQGLRKQLRSLEFRADTTPDEIQSIARS